VKSKDLPWSSLLSSKATTLLGCCVTCCKCQHYRQIILTSVTTEQEARIGRTMRAVILIVQHAASPQVAPPIWTSSRARGAILGISHALWYMHTRPSKPLVSENVIVQYPIQCSCNYWNSSCLFRVSSVFQNSFKDFERIRILSHGNKFPEWDFGLTCHIPN
jgi:hypothetical protein